ncbi:uncharacterized protein MEPE_04834 [Melanopsichium pennsylvanicum]|uniref:DUF1751-domain-containing protein n=2 Tax=Melanopsichium pennsylvanicum TaxID=63383 RepID=A0AAJ4XPI2_9BASI|nr:conserved hypothetical protein [Melanopsichium pennsylvanicum 4]SNX86125.1 uncharacterized protein MEPE_04834 [Melanopsichium pennsylvanicum]
MAVLSLSTLLQKVPPGTRFLTGALLSFTTLLFFLRLHTGLGFNAASAVQFQWLVIVPGASFWYPWTLITSSFCESSILEFLVSIVSLPLAARYLERQWGAIELVKFAAVILVGSNIIAWGLQLLLFGVFRKEVLIWGIQFHGLQALQTAFLVAFTQLIPEHQVQIFSGALKLRVKDLPMLYVTVSNIMCLIGYTSPWILIQFGWLISWAYLRFFKINESGFKGDRSEAFAFVNWFPPIAHKPVQFISTTLFNLFVRIKVVQPWTGGDYAELESATLNGQVPQHGSARAEAERRRAMALKALDQRLSANKGAGSRSNNLQRSDSVKSSGSTLTPKEDAASTTSAAEVASGSTSTAPGSIPTVVFEAPADDLPTEKECK